MEGIETGSGKRRDEEAGKRTASSDQGLNSRTLAEDVRTFFSHLLDPPLVDPLVFPLGHDAAANVNGVGGEHCWRFAL